MKLSHAAILSLALPVSLAAQQPAAGQQADPITAAFRGRTMGLQRNIAQAFDSIPESKFGYKPTPAQLTIGYIAQHLASDNYLFCDAFGSMKAAVPAEDTVTADSVKATWPKERLVGKLKASFAYCEKAIPKLDPATFGQQVQFMGRQMTKGFIAVHTALDWGDHYAMVAMYLRLNGMVPPSAQKPPAKP